MTERVEHEGKLNNEVILITSCQACGSGNLYQFLDFGQMPKPNIYLNKDEVLRYGQVTYQLNANLCTDCGLVQLGQIIPPEALFAKNYAYRTPDAMREDFRESAEETIRLAQATPKDKVLEIGSNIGICLQEYQNLGFHVLGVDPAVMYAQQANELGTETIIAPFNPSLADEIVKERGKMKIVTAANVMQHIPDIRGTVDAIRKVLAPDGVFTLEFPYLGNILDNTDFDTFYAEHNYYFSLRPLQRLFNEFGLTIVHAKKLPNIHCGSMRIFVKHKPAKIGEEVQTILEEENQQGLTNPQRYDDFEERVNDIMYENHLHLYVAKRRGDFVAAHGASAKFVTFTNLGHIGPREIEYVADSTPAKQGKVTPGMAIPIFSEEKLLEDAPDIIFNGIRNFYDQNKKKYEEIKKRNPRAKILIPIPKVSYK